jgi:hypothetical protein
VGINTVHFRGTDIRPKIGNSGPGFSFRLENVPFVVVADGERIYLGAFMTGFSSMVVALPWIFAVAQTVVASAPAPADVRLVLFVLKPCST